MHISGHEAVVRMDEFPGTAVQAGLLEGRRMEVETKRSPVKPSSFLPGPQPRNEVMKEQGSRVCVCVGGCHVTLSTLGPPHPQSPPPQHPELGGAGWAHSAGSTVLSSDCRPTGSPATERKGNQDFTTAEASRGAQPASPSGGSCVYPWKPTARLTQRAS